MSIHLSSPPEPTFQFPCQTFSTFLLCLPPFWDAFLPYCRLTIAFLIPFSYAFVLLFTKLVPQHDAVYFPFCILIVTNLFMQYSYFLGPSLSPFLFLIYLFIFLCHAVLCCKVCILQYIYSCSFSPSFTPVCTVCLYCLDFILDLLLYAPLSPFHNTTCSPAEIQVRYSFHLPPRPTHSCAWLHS